MTKYFIALASLLISINSFGFRPLDGDKVGNGGGLWMCTPYGTIQKAFLIDLYEAQEEFGLSLIQSSEVDPMKIVQERAEFMRWNISKYASTWDFILTNSMAKIRLVDSELVIVDDALFRIKPSKSSCLANWEYTQFANFTHQDQILIRADLWVNPIIKPLDKAALIWHEVIYKWLRDNYQEKDSVRARQIVGLLFSDLPGHVIQAQIDKVLAKIITPVPPMPPIPPPVVETGWFCMVKNNHILTYYGAFAPRQLEAKSKAMNECKNGEDGFFCSSSVSCDEIKIAEQKYTCEVHNNHQSLVFMGLGRSKLEAEFNARNECQTKSDKFFCAAHVTCE